MLRGFSFLLALEEAVSSGNSQLIKVVEMLEDMQRTGLKKLQEEQVAYSKFSQHCVDEQQVLASEIETAAEEMKGFAADIEMSESNAAKLEAEIAAHNADINKYEAQKKSDTAERKEARAAALAEQQDYSESVDALTRAVSILKRQAFDRKQDASLVQLPDRAKQLVQAFYQSEDPSDPGVADGYEFQSGGILELLKKLKAEFKEKLTTAQNEERNAQHAYEMVMDDLTHQLTQNKKAVGEKTVAMQNALKAAGKAKANLAATTEEHSDQSETLKDLKTECSEKALSFEEKQKLAADEQEALKEAIKIIQTVPTSFLQTRMMKSSFVQIKTQTQHISASKVYEFLSQKSVKLQSKELALLANKMSEGPFDKVIGLIKGMINKLRDEAQKDAEKQSFCTKEVAASEADRSRLNAQLDSLTADHDEAVATAAELKETITKLRAEVVEADKMLQEATALHLDEKARAEKTIEESKGAQQAVASARTVLTEFYAKASKATAFVQLKKTSVPTVGSDEWNALANPNFQSSGVGYGQKALDGVNVVDEGHKEGMQTFGEVNQGQQEASTGVIAMLDVILSDFARAEAEASTLLEESTTNYEKLQKDTKRDKMVKEKKIEMSESDMNEANADAQTAKRDIESTNDQLAAAMRSWESIEKQCVDKGVSFEERAAKRQEEIQALKEALEMLS